MGKKREQHEYVRGFTEGLRGADAMRSIDKAMRALTEQSKARGDAMGRLGGGHPEPADVPTPEPMVGPAAPSGVGSANEAERQVRQRVWEMKVDEAVALRAQVERLTAEADEFDRQGAAYRVVADRQVADLTAERDMYLQRLKHLQGVLGMQTAAHTKALEAIEGYAVERDHALADCEHWRQQAWAQYRRGSLDAPTEPPSDLDRGPDAATEVGGPPWKHTMGEHPDLRGFQAWQDRQ